MTTLSGYSTTNDFWGTRFSQLSLQEISLHVTVDQIVSGFVQRPDPNIRLEHNRAIKVQHAEEFAAYLRRGAEDQSGKWIVIVPALSLFTSPLALEFLLEPGQFPAGDVEFGTVRIEKSTPLQIWDGQHRTLGCYMAVERINKEMTDLLTKSTKAKAAGDAETVAKVQADLQALRTVRRQLGGIVIPATITIETDQERIAALFADVADNAKGINATALARLDHRNVFNRVAAAIYDGSDDWTLLKGFIDDDNAYVTQNSPFWTTYRDVAAVAQTCWLGHGARWTENKEQTGLADQEKEILANVRQFYEALVEAFPDIEDVLSETSEPRELRQGGERTSLLSSSTTVRALASAWHDLRFGHRWVLSGKRVVSGGFIKEEWTPTEIAAAFAKLPSMSSGSEKVLNRYWRSKILIDAPWVAPTARAGNSRSMGMAMVDYIETSGE